LEEWSNGVVEWWQKTPFYPLPRYSNTPLLQYFGFRRVL
jgi:hypothetical protein